MKTALVRILTIATLATSLSAFAATDEPKTDNAAGASATQQQEGCAASHKEKKQKKAKSQRDERTEQEKEFDRVLMGYYGVRRLQQEPQTLTTDTLMTLIYTDQESSTRPFLICKSVSSVFIRGEICFLCKETPGLKPESLRNAFGMSKLMP